MNERRAPRNPVLFLVVGHDISGTLTNNMGVMDRTWIQARHMARNDRRKRDPGRGTRATEHMSIQSRFSEMHKLTEPQAAFETPPRPLPPLSPPLQFPALMLSIAVCLTSVHHKGARVRPRSPILLRRPASTPGVHTQELRPSHALCLDSVPPWADDIHTPTCR